MSLRVFILALSLTLVIIGASMTTGSADFDWDNWYNRGMGVRIIDELGKRGNGLGSGRYVRKCGWQIWEGVCGRGLVCGV